ncbi:hypothetical protein F4861DRAFT_544457 [Xylaria intraflava]|nr:hypothetical protein F4861DRAFT_544457 [Xylaria intraflava]
MPPAHSTRAKTPAQNLSTLGMDSNLGLTGLTASEHLQAAMLRQDEQNEGPDITLGQSTAVDTADVIQRVEKRIRADSGGASFPTEEELVCRKLALCLRKLQREEEEEERLGRQALEGHGTGTQFQNNESGTEFQEIREYPSIVTETARKFPGVDPKYVFAIYKNELDPMNLIKLCTGGYISITASQLHASSTTGHITMIAPLAKIEAYGTDISLWAYCFTTYVAIYGQLFPEHLHIVRAMNDFLRRVFELATVHELRPVIGFAASRIRLCNITPHKAQLWSERDPDWEASFLSISTHKIVTSAASTLTSESEKRRKARNKSEICNRWNDATCVRGFGPYKCVRRHVCRKCGSEAHKEPACIKKN